MNNDFDLHALFRALDEQRRAQSLTWAGLTRAVNRSAERPQMRHPLATSTIKGLGTKRVAEADGVLQMLVWLGRSPESFVPDHNGLHPQAGRLPDVGAERILRFDLPAIYTAMRQKREAGGLTWADVARAIGGCTPAMLTRYSRHGRTGFPDVMRVTRWLGQPVVRFTRVVLR